MGSKTRQRRLPGEFVGAREKPSQKLGVAPKGHNSQFFASFFFLREGYFALCGERQGLCPLTPPPFEKGGRKLSRLGSAVDVYSLSSLAQLLRSLAQKNYRLQKTEDGSVSGCRAASKSADGHKTVPVFISRRASVCVNQDIPRFSL